eukprot:scaffold537863_cov29-Prasinocladus_malaysianus.AAC.1
MLDNVPDLVDVRSMSAVLESTGAAVHRMGGAMEIDAKTLVSCQPCPEAVGALRAGFLVLGANALPYRANISKLRHNGCYLEAYGP